MIHDSFFWAFIFVALLLGFVYTSHRISMGAIEHLYQTIDSLRLERDAQAGTIQWQRRVIAELEKEKERSKQ